MFTSSLSFFLSRALSFFVLSFAHSCSTPNRSFFVDSKNNQVYRFVIFSFVFSFFFFVLFSFFFFFLLTYESFLTGRYIHTHRILIFHLKKRNDTIECSRHDEHEKLKRLFFFLFFIYEKKFVRQSWMVMNIIVRKRAS